MDRSKVLDEGMALQRELIETELISMEFVDQGFKATPQNLVALIKRLRAASAVPVPTVDIVDSLMEQFLLILEDMAPGMVESMRDILKELQESRARIAELEAANKAA